MNSSDVFLKLLRDAVAELEEESSSAPRNPSESAPDALPGGPPDAAAQALGEAARRMRDNFPYASPLYAGQMLKPPHVAARAAYAMAMGVNPNNHALDGGRASSAMEVEAVAQIAAMAGFDRGPGSFLGHLTSGGTFANLEALWVAGQVTGKKMVVASEQAHYTHARISGVLGMPFASIAVDDSGCMSMDALEQELRGGQVGTVVATLGTTGIGAVDPLHRVLELREKYGFRVHVDAAYGGYFMLAANLAAASRAAFDAIRKADSLVIDPHKHGLQPYGCGCVLFADAEVGRLYKHDSPYTYYSSRGMHLGELTLECSRAGAAAVALWTTQRLLPLVPGGEFGQGMERCREAALQLFGLLEGSGCFVVPMAAPQLDIVVWACPGATVDESSARARQVFEEAAQRGLHLALAELPVSLFPPESWSAGETVTCLRSVLMKWEHLEWVKRIFALIMRTQGQVWTNLALGNEAEES